ncbi:APC family permease [Streptomyces violaceusniger]
MSDNQQVAAPGHESPADTAPVDGPPLHRSLGRSDIFFMLVCTLVGIDGLGALTTRGGAAFTWTIGSVVLFAVPSALLLAELGAAYTGEGGPYLWVRMAFGRLPAAVSNVFYWGSNPVWVGGTLVGAAAGGMSVFFGDGAGYSTPAMYAIGLPFIWGMVLITTMPVAALRWAVRVGALSRFLLFGLFTVVVLAYGVQHGFHGIAASSFTPTFAGFSALVPLIIFSLSGFELPSAAGDEMLDASRDVPSAIGRSLLATSALYGLPLLGILLVLPPGQANSLSGFPEAVKQAMTVFGGSVSSGGPAPVVTLSGAGTGVGWLMGALIVAVTFTSGLTWVMGSDRAMAVSCLDGAGPRALGRFSARYGTPLRVNLLSGAVATVVFAATQLITGGDVFKFFSVALSLATSTTLMSYLAIFPCAWVLRRSRPGDRRPFRAPAIGMATALTTLLVAFGTVEALCPGLGGGWFSQENLPSAQWRPGERLTYLGAASVPLVLFVLIGFLFWFLGARQRRTGPTSVHSPVDDSGGNTAATRKEA